MSGNKLKSVISKIGVIFLKSVVPELIRNCPYPVGRYSVVDAKATRKMILGYPNGIGRIVVTVLEDNKVLVNASVAIRTFD